MDNGSSDGSIDGLEGRYSNLNLRVERLGKNTGFSIANNAGARLAQGAWLALLNSDAFAAADWLESFMHATRQYADFAFFGSRQVQANTPELLDGAGDVYHVSGLAWRRFTGMAVSEWGREAVEVFSPCAAAALYRREAFQQAGGFDEDFRSYHEDVDLGFRLRLLGYRCMYIPEAVVYHIGSASTGKLSPHVIYQGHRNLEWGFIKNMPSPYIWLYLPLHLAMNVYFLFSFSFKGQASSIWRAKWDAMKGLGLMLTKRKKVQAEKRISGREIYACMERNWLAPLWARRSGRSSKGTA